MEIAVWVVGVYGVFTLVGGIIGYVKAKSRASLIAGGICGLALIACAKGMAYGDSLGGIASFGALLIALVLGTRFFMTWRRTRRLMPDLLMMIFSMATLAAVGLALVPQ